MKKYFFLLASFMSILLRAQTPDWLEAKTSFTDQIATDGVGATKILSDHLGNRYLAGYFYKTDIGFETLGLYNSGGSSPYDAFVIKYNREGNVEWGRRISGTGGTQAETIRDMHWDESGNLIIYGNTSSIQLILGPDTLTFTQLDQNIFISKMNTDGNYIWSKGLIGAGAKYAGNLGVDALGNIYFTGLFLTTIRIGTTTLSGNKDGFIAKLNASGTALWARKISGSGGYENVSTLAVSRWGDAYITGYFQSDPISVSGTLLNKGNGDMYMARFDSSGHVRSASVPGSGYCFSMECDDAGSVYLSGNFDNDSIRFGGMVAHSSIPGTGAGNWFIMKADSAGTANWIRNGAGTGASKYCYTRALDVDHAGCVVFTSVFSSDSLNVGTHIFTNTNSSNSQSDFVIGKYDPDGHLLWADQCGGSGDDESTCLTIDDEDNILIAGIYSSDPLSLGTIQLHSSNIGGHDIFMAKRSGYIAGMNESVNTARIVYPNPVKEKFFVMNPEGQNLKLFLFSIDGDLLKTSGSSFNSSSQLKMDVSEIPCGIYFLKIQEQNGMYKMAKIIKQ